MRASLRWALVSTIGLSGIAVLWQPKAVQPIQAVEREAQIEGSPLTTGSKPHGARLAISLPRELPAYALKPAERDLFGAVSRPAAPLLAAGAETPASEQPPPSVAPVAAAVNVAPPLSAQLVGIMVTPEGRRIVLLAREGEPFVASPGATTPEGWVVQAVEATQVRWVYPPLGSALELPIPAPLQQTALVSR